MSDDALADLLQHLSSLSEKSRLDDVLASLAPQQSTVIREVRRVCALVRRFDEELYRFLTANIPGATPFGEFVKSDDVQVLGAGYWALTDNVRAPLLKAWQDNEDPTVRQEWQEWNGRLAIYLAQRDGKDEQLNALYHYAASSTPEKCEPLFRSWYREAENAFDLAQCNALLEILQLQAPFRGSRLSSVWREHRQYYQARSLFLDDYYKTGAYFFRLAPLTAFQNVFAPAPGAPKAPWIFHIHATGGTGKTMFLRWLIVHRLLPKRVPCARVDLDYRLRELVQFPMRVLRSIVEQWSVQLQRVDLTSLMPLLNKSIETPGWSLDVVADVSRSLATVDKDTKLVVILDTLEEATLSEGMWLQQCIDELRSLRRVHPRIILVLAGRYDITQYGQRLREGEIESYELPRFTPGEAREYLLQRGLKTGEVLDAIVERAAGGEEVGGDSRLAGLNPFKLAMFAELALNRTSLTRQQVMDFPRADVAYLIERVIKRIESQPLRWAIRYGAIARDLTIDFMNEVLLPPLRDALRGKVPDDTNLGLDGEFRDVWVRDERLADAVTAEALWEQLHRYQRDRGWISAHGTGHTESLRFHPDVVVPTRDLLRKQPVFNDLQTRATAYFEARAKAARADAASFTRHTREAIFHQFQLRGPTARGYWLRKVRAAEERWDAAFAAEVAGEITGSDYARRQRVPRVGMTTPKILSAAHCKAAELWLQSAGVGLASGDQRHIEFSKHMGAALDIERENGGVRVPVSLRALYKSLKMRNDEEAAGVLQSALERATKERERMLLEVHLAKRFESYALQDSLKHYRSALERMPAYERSGPAAFELYLKVTDLHIRLGAIDHALKSLQAASVSAKADPRLQCSALEKGALAALMSNDPTGAAWFIERLTQHETSAHSSRFTVPLLQARRALLSGNAWHAQQFLSVDGERSDAEQAQIAELMGQAHALTMSFELAFDAWEQAASKYDAVSNFTGATRCVLQRAHLLATSCGNLLDAQSVLRSSVRPGRLNEEIAVDHGVLLAFTAYSRGQQTEAKQIFLGTLLDLEPQLPAIQRARLLMFGLAFDLADATVEYVDRVLNAAKAVRPARARAGILEWCRYSREHISVPASALNRLRNLFGIGGEEAPRDVHSCLGRADLCRLLHDVPEAVSQLHRMERQPQELATNAAEIWQEWQKNGALLRLGIETAFRSLLNRMLSSGLPVTPLNDAIRLEAAWECHRLGSQEAAKIVEQGFELLNTGRNSVWQARAAELRALMGRRSEYEISMERCVRLYAALGDELNAQRVRAMMQLPVPLEPEGPDSWLQVNLTEETVSASLRTSASSIERTIDILLADERQLTADMLRCVQQQTIDDGLRPLLLELSASLETLPWELMPRHNLEIFRSVTRPHAQVHADDDIPTRVLLVVPNQEAVGVTLESDSGFSLEHLYSLMNTPVRLSSVVNPDPERLLSALRESRPHLIHITAAVREAYGGVYLDFEGTVSHAFEVAQSNAAQERSTRELTWSSRRLADVLNRALRSCTVMLDIAGQQNLAEDIRMLLLRNRFASQVTQLAAIRALIATGHAQPEERADLTLQVLRNIFEDGPVRGLARLRHTARGAPLQAALPRAGTAVWTSNPEVRIWESRP